jgi:phage/plasmid-associated DNA primase
VLTDRRAGHNGKTSLVELLMSFFGAYSEANHKFVCCGAFERDRDSHDAGMEPLRGKRFLVAEELKGSMSLDVGILKRITGGFNVRIKGRRCGSAELFIFLWQAGVVLVFNEGDCPKFDPADAAFLSRMLVIPMRSKFVQGEAALAAAIARGEELVFLADTDLQEKFPGWRSALLDVLLDSMAPVKMFDDLSADMMAWRQDVTAASNPYSEWLEEHIVVTGDTEKDFLLVQDLHPDAVVNRTTV